MANDAASDSLGALVQLNGALCAPNVLEHIPKRRKWDSDQNGGELPHRAVSLRRRQLEHELEHGKKLLHRALKVGRGFERQKLGRRQKAAKDKQDQAELARLEAEVVALKSLDLSVVAEVHLHKTLLKTKSIASAPAFPRQTVSSIKNGGFSSDAPTTNVTARLYNSNPVKTAMTDMMTIFRTILGLGSADHPSKKGVEDGSHELRNKKPGSPSREITVTTNGETTTKLESMARTSQSPEWTGFSDIDQIAFESNDGQDLDFAMYEARLASSSDSGSEEETPINIHPARMGDYHTAASTDIAISPSSSLSESLSPPPRKIHKAKAVPLAANSTFIPTLMGGYWSGSESPAEDDMAEPKSRNNRMGQQARRLLWEKKFGKKANHLKGQGRDQDWDARKGATSRSDRGRRGRGRGSDRGPASNQGMGKGGLGSGANSDPVKARMKGKNEEGPLHPSWEAARKAKEQKTNVAFQGRKVVFE